MKLSELEKGRKAIINHLDLDDDLKKRFSSMGLNSGTVLKVCRKTFGCDSLHVKIEHSSCLALSKQEASRIEVTHMLKNSFEMNEKCKFEDNDKCCKID